MVARDGNREDEKRYTEDDCILSELQVGRMLELFGIKQQAVNRLACRVGR